MIPMLRMGQKRLACQRSALRYVRCQLLCCGAGTAAGERVPVPVKPFQEKCNWNGPNSEKTFLVL